MSIDFAGAHTMGWSKIVGVCGAAMLLTACGILGGGAAATPVAATPTTAAPSATSVPGPPTRAAASPPAAASPVPKPAATAAAAAAPATKPDTVWVGNTDGEGVYVRKTPAMADRLKPYPDGTPLTIVGDDVDADGQHWKHVKTPDGIEGYVPAIYTVETPP